MDGRIGTLDVRYETAGSDPMILARLPALTRAIGAQLAEEIERRLSMVVGDVREVFVVRELTVSTSLDASWTFDRPIVEQMGRASVDALSEAVARPTDGVVRFEDPPDYLCAFIIDELDGIAAERWYFDALRRFRRGDARRTIEAVLAGHPAEAATAVERLAERGRLDDLLTILGAKRVFRLIVESPVEKGRDDVAALVDAAVRLISLAGWELDDRLRETLRRGLLMRQADEPPAWTDRRVLSAFVLRAIDDAGVLLASRGLKSGEADRDALERCLRGPLDWLDGDWLLARLVEDRASRAADDAAGQAVRDQVNEVMRRIAQAIEEGRIPILSTDTVEAVSVRLIAAAQTHSQIPLVRAGLVEAVPRVVRHARVPLVATESVRGTTGELPVALTPAEERIARVLAPSSTSLPGLGEPTDGASLYMLSRAVLDAGVPRLANAHGVPLSPLLAALAIKWLQLAAPLSGPALAWTGAACAAETEFGPDDASKLRGLEDAITMRLLDQQVFDEVPALPCDATDSLERIARLLLRAWSRWLPGLESSSLEFLRDRCLRRGGSVRRTDRWIEVTLEPAPLDVVLELAGYLKPIEVLPWVGGCTVVFDIRRQAMARGR